MKKKKMMLILVLLLTIGFASVSTTLVMNGVIGIANKKEDFNVIFTSASINGNNEAKATISENKKSITFETDKLSIVGDSAELIYKVKNNSTQYDANVTISCTGGNEEYLNIESEFAGKTLPLATPEFMKAQEVRMGRIRAELKKAYVGEDKSIPITCKIEVEGEERDSIQEYKDEYTEVLLNGADPVIKEGLVPVTIEDDGTVKKADTSSDWYSYENKKWANAVILSDETITYNDNEIIPEENIESYFVWIPKYSYQLWDLGNYNSVINGKPTELNARSIEIEFGTGNTSDEVVDECTTPMNEDKTQGLSGESGNCQVGDYMTHPAFISMGTNGLWVGKFETTGTTSNITIKPGVASLKNLNVKTMFDTAYNYNRSLDSHMMKNTEWGAVAYLSHSQYGIDSEININNNSNFLTGYSSATGVDQSSYPGTAGTDTSVTLPYNTETGYKASTTGNISGIYDMSGGAHEYMASYMSGQMGASGFSDVTNPTYNKYLDVYSTSSAVLSLQYRILGDATGEMGPFSLYEEKDVGSRAHNDWYADNSAFVDSSYPWFLRGGYCGYDVLAGQLDFERYTGTSAHDVSFRLVLS